MRVLFCCMPAHGHLYPVLPLASALRDAGHDVRFGTGVGFVDRVRALGFPADPVGISIPEASRLAEQRYPGRPGPELGLIAFAEIAAAAAATDLRPLLGDLRPDLVVYEETQFGAAVAARLAGVRAVCHSLSRQMPYAMYQGGPQVDRTTVDQSWSDAGLVRREPVSGHLPAEPARPRCGRAPASDVAAPCLDDRAR